MWSSEGETAPQRGQARRGGLFARATRIRRHVRRPRRETRELKDAIKELVGFIESNEPRIVAYNVYFSDDRRQMTVIHAHVDCVSLEYHMEIAGPAFGPFADLVTLSSICIYGEPSDKALRQLHDKAQLLGGGAVSVHRPHAGFTRFAADRRET